MKWLLLFASIAAPAHAFVRTLNNSNLCIWWGPRGHSFVIDAQGTPDVPGTAAFDAIRKSFATWAAVTCSDLTFPDLGTWTDRRVGYFPGQANQNVVLFRTVHCLAVAPAGDPCLGVTHGCANKYDCWDGRDDSIIATTTTTTNSNTGQIVDSDVEMNDAPGMAGAPAHHFTAVGGTICVPPQTTGCVDYDVQNTVTHEAGHTLGLGHTTYSTATMYASAPRGETSKRVLHPDDISGICTIYPVGARTVTCVGNPITLTAVSSSDGGCGCSHARVGPGATLGGLAFLLALRRRQKRGQRSNTAIA